MAAKVDKDVTTPESTGAVKLDDKPVTTEQVADNASTGEVKHEAPGETSVDYHGADAVVRTKTDTEPVTMSVSWLSDATAKVVTPEADKAEASTSAKAETKSGDN